MSKKDNDKIVLDVPKPRRGTGAGKWPARRQKDKTKTIPRDEKYKGQDLV